jgi:integrase/recombinase XerD
MVKEKEVLRKDEIEKLLDVARPTEKLMIQILLNTGMKVSELCNFTISWISWKDSIITISSNKHKKKRVIHISEELLKKLKEFISIKEEKGFVFLSKKGGKYLKTSIIRKINEISQQVFGKNIGTEIFRNTFAWNNLNLEVDELQKLLGHASAGITWDFIQNLPKKEGGDKN